MTIPTFNGYKNKMQTAGAEAPAAAGNWRYRSSRSF